MTTRWKYNLKNFTMYQWFSTCSVLEVKEKFVEVEATINENMEGGEDELRNHWDQGLRQRVDVEGR
jgi:hypothetical protein